MFFISDTTNGKYKPLKWDRQRKLLSNRINIFQKKLTPKIILYFKVQKGLLLMIKLTNIYGKAMTIDLRKDAPNQVSNVNPDDPQMKLIHFKK